MGGRRGPCLSLEMQKSQDSESDILLLRGKFCALLHDSRPREFDRLYRSRRSRRCRRRGAGRRFSAKARED